MRLKKLPLPVLIFCLTVSILISSAVNAEESYSTLGEKYSKSLEDIKAARAFAKCAIDWGKYDTGIEVYKRLLDSNDPKIVAKHHEVRMDLAKVYLSLDDFQAAGEILEKIDLSQLNEKSAKKVKKLKKRIKKRTNPHKFGFSLGIAATTTDNIVKTPSSFEAFDEIEGDDFEDDFDEDSDFSDGFDSDGFLEDLEDEIEIDDDDLADQEVLDLDGDGIDDAFDGDIDEDIEGDSDGDSMADDDLADDDPTDDDLADDDTAADDGDDSSDGGNDNLSRTSSRNKNKKESDIRYDAKVGAQYGYLLSPKGHYWNSAVILLGSLNQDREDLDRTNVLVGTGPVINIPGWRLKINPSLNYVYLNKDSEDIFESLIPSIATTFKASPTLSFLARYNFESREFDQDSSPDVDIDTLKFALKYKLTKKDLIGLSYSPKIEDSSKSTKDKDQHGFGASYTHEFSYKIFSTLKANYKTAEFDNVSPVRKDDEYNYSVVLGKKFKNGFRMFIGGNAKDKDSNIDGKSSNSKALIIGTDFKY